jgi:hypothetical protein
MRPLAEKAPGAQTRTTKTANKHLLEIPDPFVISPELVYVSFPVNTPLLLTRQLG